MPVGGISTEQMKIDDVVPEMAISRFAKILNFLILSCKFITI